VPAVVAFVPAVVAIVPAVVVAIVPAVVAIVPAVVAAIVPAVVGGLDHPNPLFELHMYAIFALKYFLDNGKVFL